MAGEKRLAFTGYTFSGLSPQEIIGICRGAGTSGFECAPPQIESMSSQEIAAFGTTIQTAGLRMDTLHMPFGRNADIASFYETERRVAVQQMSVWLEKAAGVGARAVIQHPSTSSNGVGTEGLTRFVDQICRSLEVLLPKADGLGIRIAIENMLPGEDRGFGSDPDHLATVAERMAHPALGFCLDTGHATVTGGVDGLDEFFDAYGESLICFHLSDTGGDRDMHIAPGRGNVDWKTLFSRAAALRSDIAMCIETAPFAWGPPYPQDEWNRLASDTRALMA